MCMWIFEQGRTQTSRDSCSRGHCDGDRGRGTRQTSVRCQAAPAPLWSEQLWLPNMCLFPFCPTVHNLGLAVVSEHRERESYLWAQTHTEVVAYLEGLRLWNPSGTWQQHHHCSFLPGPGLAGGTGGGAGIQDLTLSLFPTLWALVCGSSQPAGSCLAVLPGMSPCPRPRHAAPSLQEA